MKARNNTIHFNKTKLLLSAPVLSAKRPTLLVSLDVAKCGKDFQEKCSNVALTRRSDLRPDADFPGEGSCHLQVVPAPKRSISPCFKRFYALSDFFVHVFPIIWSATHSDGIIYDFNLQVIQNRPRPKISTEKGPFGYGFILDEYHPVCCFTRKITWKHTSISKLGNLISKKTDSKMGLKQGRRVIFDGI